jgi:dTMP kinase
MTWLRLYSGLFVTIDGPGGAGKTATTRHLAEMLTAQGHQVHATAQPSRGQLGQIARASADIYRGRALACLITADRYHQQDTEIRPAREAGRIVVCDRYVASSYVLQRLDGVPIEDIEVLNAAADRPDLAVILTAQATVIAARINARGTRHRFERGLSTSTQEVELYVDAALRLAESGYPLLTLDTTNAPVATIAEQIAARIAELDHRPTTPPAIV